MYALTINEKLWWPNLERYGAKLSIADNPSAERRFMRLEITNPQRFVQAGGLSGAQLVDALRGAGFVHARLETEARAFAQYDRIMAAHRRERDAELAARHVLSFGMVFYAAGVRRPSPALIRQFLPRFAGHKDGEEIELASVTHPDFQYGTEQAIVRFIRTVQRQAGVRLATFYLAGKPVDAADITQGHPLPLVAANCWTMLGPDQRPLKMPAPHALARAFPTPRAAAGHGNITPVIMPHGLPISTARDGSLLVVKDGRWTEFNPIALAV
ncbi:hypothetical protein [Burkholderia gladioli]|uniref:hypothetical protein n=1 Tax=Burkholderia gladioli TaxID=28095 RepID=UPI00163E4475|nr:hypothetical protein [Burkholderia gladioli]